MTDALNLFRAARPEPPEVNSPDIRRAQVSAPRGQVDLHSLAVVPGTPGYNARIPRPPCYRCGEDHAPGVDYNHEWVAEPVAYADAPVSAAPRRPVDAAPLPPQTEVTEVVPQRVALYVGRGDTYVISVERAPDWDAETTFKVEPEMVVPMISLVRALGVKVSDKTGGDLVMLQQEYGNGRRSEHAQADARSTPRTGSDLARRQEPDPDQPPGDPAQGAPGAGGDVPESGGVGQDPAGSDVG